MKASEDQIIDIFKLDETEKNRIRLPIMREIIEVHQKRGDIRDDMDSDLLAVFLHYARRTFQQYLFQKIPGYNSHDTKKTLSSIIYTEALKSELSEYIRLIKSALRPEGAKGGKA